jgi:8-oxo-dGTP pyrophosphatase MutT (NUDIX family)
MPRHKRHRRPAAKQAPADHRPTAGRPPTGRRPTTHRRRQRWFYDVRQYALITDSQGKVLILQLPAEYDEGAANTWTLPGGKLEPADDPAAGLLREIKEETGLKVEIDGPCTVARWSTRNSKKLGIFYAGSVRGKEPRPTLSGEHQRALWATLAEVADFPFHRPDMLTVIKQHLGK